MDISNQQAYLLKYCQNGDNKSLARLFQRGNVYINHIYKYNKTEYNAFQVTCMELHALIDDESYDRIEDRYADCCRILLEKGIDIKYKDPDFRAEAIEYSLFSGSTQIVKQTIKTYQERKYSVKHMELIPMILFFFGKKLNERQLSIIEVLLDSGVDINVCDYETGETPIYQAAKAKHKNVVELFLRKKFREIEIDCFVDKAGRSARYLIIRSNLYDGKLPTIFSNHMNTIYNALFKNNTIEFLNEYHQHPDLPEDEKILILFRSIHTGNVEIVEYMLEETESFFENHIKLLEIASKRGFYKIVKLLFEERKIHFDFTLLQHLVAMNRDNRIELEENPEINFDICLKYLLEHSTLNLNQLDRQDKTLLQIAINSRNNKMVLTLLNSGASLITYNTAMEDEECFVMNVPPQVLEDHFDHSVYCVYEKYLKRKRILNDKIMVTYILSFQSILPPRYDIEPRKRTAFPPENVVIFSKYLAEIKVLHWIAENSDYMYLLKHPFVLTFIALKWHRVKCIFYTDILIFFIYIFVFNLYIIIGPDVLYPYVWIWGVLTVIMTLLWNCVQIFLFQLKYFTVLENWIKLCLFSVSIALLAISSPFYTSRECSKHTYKHDYTVCYAKRQMEGIFVLLSMSNLFFLMGHFPRVSIYVIMIKSIYQTIFESIVQYSFLLIGFASSFYLLFHNVYRNFFGNFPIAFIKTIIMAGRDYDSNNLQLWDRVEFPFVRFFIVLAFVVLISLGLLNLLTGLAINDVQKMKENAELYSEILRIQNINKLENIFVNAKLMKRMSLMRVLSLYSIFDKRPVVEIDPKKKVGYVLGENFLNIKIDKKILTAIENLLRKKGICHM